MEELRWIYRTAPGMMESKIKFQFSQSNLFLIDEFNWADLCRSVCRLYLRTFNGWITVPAIDGTRWPFLAVLAYPDYTGQLFADVG